MEQKLKIPEGVGCEYKDGTLTCRKDSIEVKRKILVPEVEVKIDNGEVSLVCEKGNKNHYKKILTNVAHIQNLFRGLNEKFVYELEVCHIHFPLSVKVDGNKLSITNFFGEKKPRFAKILPGVEVEIKGQNIKVLSMDKESAGQTAANFEKATKVKGKDKRIYQDGIYITAKPEVVRNA